MPVPRIAIPVYVIRGQVFVVKDALFPGPLGQATGGLVEAMIRAPAYNVLGVGSKSAPASNAVSASLSWGEAFCGAMDTVGSALCSSQPIIPHIKKIEKDSKTV